MRGELSRSNSELQSVQGELRAEKDRLRLLLDLTNNLVATPNIREALKTVIGTVRQIAESDFVGVGLPDPDNPNYALDFVVDGDIHAGEFVPNEETLPVRLFRTDGALGEKTGHLTKNQVWENTRLDGQFKTFCVQPLLSRDGALGILVLARRDDKPYGRDDMNFLAQVSYQIDIALENGLAYWKI